MSLLRRKASFRNKIFRERQSGRRGYTVLEILIAVTLMLMLMFGVAVIFNRVGSSMNDTMSTMEMTNSLRNAKNRLNADLKTLTVPEVVAPRNSNDNDGYFCYIEGTGGSYDRVWYGNSGKPFTTADIAYDSDRTAVSGLLTPDNTAGDTDDILMFTARAPSDRKFRGRFIQPVYTYTNGQQVVTGGKQIILESEYAEIVWFVRGTTLYRRTLFIRPPNRVCPLPLRNC